MQRIDTVVIAPRFSGPAGTGNGGYVSALVAAPIEGTARSTLRRPAPLEVPLERRYDGQHVELLHDGELVAEAEPAVVDVEAPAPTTFEVARDGHERFPWRDDHVFPLCFTCGTARTPGDGLLIQCGPLDDGRFACDWTPDPTLDDGTGLVRPEFVWAALDCPTAAPWIASREGNAALLGQLAVRQDARVRVGEPHVVVSASLGDEGRKRYGVAALYTASGDLLAVSRATWIALREPPAS